MPRKPRPGSIGWIDLTAPNAATLRDFYQAVVGWKTSSVSMGKYDDFCMHPAANQPPVAGICHARGTNSKLPAQWLIYIVVPDLKASVAACRKAGGTILVRPKSMGPARYAVIRDPAGAVAALYQPE